MTVSLLAFACHENVWQLVMRYLRINPIRRNRDLAFRFVRGESLVFSTLVSAVFLVLPFGSSVASRISHAMPPTTSLGYFRGLLPSTTGTLLVPHQRVGSAFRLSSGGVLLSRFRWGLASLTTHDMKCTLILCGLVCCMLRDLSARDSK